MIMIIYRKFHFQARVDEKLAPPGTLTAVYRKFQVQQSAVWLTCNTIYIAIAL